MGKIIRRKISIYKSRLSFVNNKNRVISVFSEYTNSIQQYFKLKKPGQAKDLRNVSVIEREKIRRKFNKNATNKYFYSTKTIYYSTVIMAIGYNKAAYLGSPVFNGKTVVVKF